MSIISIPYTFTTGNPIIAGEHNLNFSRIYNDYNGNITTANISPSAAIVDTQLAQIVSISKVSGAALTSLNSVPTGANALPSKNGGTGADLSATAQGAVPYFSATGVASALAAGTAGQYLQSQGASANPIWTDGIGTPVSKSDSTSYQALTDGFFVGVVTGGTDSKVDRIIGYTDGSNPPTTEMGAAFTLVSNGTIAATSNANRASFCIPVKRGNYYKGILTSVGSGSAGSVLYYFIPVGT